MISEIEVILNSWILSMPWQSMEMTSMYKHVLKQWFNRARCNVLNLWEVYKFLLMTNLCYCSTNWIYVSVKWHRLIEENTKLFNYYTTFYALRDTQYIYWLFTWTSDYFNEILDWILRLRWCMITNFSFLIYYEFIWV